MDVVMFTWKNVNSHPFICLCTVNYNKTANINVKKLHFNQVLTATCIKWHIENSKNDKKVYWERPNCGNIRRLVEQKRKVPSGCFCVTYFFQVITESLTRQCKCHGVSGSCSMRTCFRSLPFDLRPVSQQLRNRYSVAVHVDPRSGVRDRTSSRRTARTSRRRRGHGHRTTPDSNTPRMSVSLRVILFLLVFFTARCYTKHGIAWDDWNLSSQLGQERVCRCAQWAYRFNSDRLKRVRHPLQGTIFLNFSQRITSVRRYCDPLCLLVLSFDRWCVCVFLRSLSYVGPNISKTVGGQTRLQWTTKKKWHIEWSRAVAVSDCFFYGYCCCCFKSMWPTGLIQLGEW